MTSTTDTTQHPDVAEISDLTEGVLPQSRTEDVRRHLDGCALCADVQASLEEIRGLLGTLSGPLRMPSDVAGRIDAALAAEALLNSTALDDGEKSDKDDGEKSNDVSRETSTAPARKEAVPPPVDRPSGHARTATGPGRTPPRRQRHRAVWGAVLGVAAVGLGTLMVQTLASDPDHMKGDSATSAKAPQRFSGKPLQDQVDTLLASSAPESLSPRNKEKNAPSIDIQESPHSPKHALSVPSCIQKGTGRTDPPLGSELGSYEGRTAFLLVLPHASDRSLVQAYVVDAACADTAPTGKGELLLTDSYPRR